VTTSVVVVTVWVVVGAHSHFMHPLKSATAIQPASQVTNSQAFGVVVDNSCGVVLMQEHCVQPLLSTKDVHDGPQVTGMHCGAVGVVEKSSVVDGSNVNGSVSVNGSWVVVVVEASKHWQVLHR